MTSVSRTYQVNNIGQLVDLNGDTTNFDITFKVVSKNREPFDIIVADQTTIDNSPELHYNRANQGEMSGHIVQDKNVYQNHFLALRSDQPCECTVEITKKEIPPKQSEKEPLDYAPPNPVEEKEESSINWKLILIVILVIAGGIALYFIYKSDKKKKELESSPHNSPEKSVQNSPSENDNSLVQRLKRLNMS